ncbi:MAG: type VI secretion system baseplate subunit TssG [Planctomycetota bacterium]
MAGANGLGGLALVRGLLEKPYRLDFFQLARRLECAAPDMPRLGEATRPDREPVRLGQIPALSFAPAAVMSSEETVSGRPQIGVRCFGLLGPQGPMPTEFTEYVQQRVHNYRDRTLEQFLNIFHHRLLQLFYRAWATGQATVSRDRPDEDHYARWVGSLLGLGVEGNRERDSIGDDAKRFNLGRLGSRSRGALGLEMILEDYFGTPVKIEQFVGEWIPIPESDQVKLGAPGSMGTLGVDAFSGERTWGCEHRFRVVVGPVDKAGLDRFLPGQPSAIRLRDWIRSYAGLLFKWDLQVILVKEDAPEIKLGGQQRLGWTTWLLSETPPEDLRDTVFPSGDP